MALPKFDDAACSDELDHLVENAKEASDFLKALAHESRLIILCILAEGERPVNELETLLSLRQPTLSQHLARLRMDGLVTARRDGKQVYYSLASPRVAKMLETVYDLFCGEGRDHG